MDYLNSQQLADMLGVGLTTVEGWRRRGKGPPYVPVEGSIRYLKADIEAWIERLKQKGASPK